MKLLPFVGVLFLLISPLARSADSLPVTGFDCWISAEGRFITHFIRCIRDRNLAADEAVEDTPEVRAISSIRRQLHAGASPEELDRLVKINADAVRRDFFANIRIYSYPSEWSWEEEQPQQLVRMLCPTGYDCRVFVRPD